jgi:hypothetical protein
MPLTAAFLHIQQVVGGEQLAEEELRLRLASGDVEAQDRWVTPGEGIEIIPLAPEAFEGPDRLLFGVYPLQSHTNFLRRVDLLRFQGHNFFALRKHVYRIWPIGGEAKKPREAALPRTRPKGIGPKVWLAANKAWELWRDGYRWPDREGLLRRVRDCIGNDGLSMRILDEALAYLRQKRLIDRR